MYTYQGYHPCLQTISTSPCAATSATHVYLLNSGNTHGHECSLCSRHMLEDEVYHRVPYHTIVGPAQKCPDSGMNSHSRLLCTVCSPKMPRSSPSMGQTPSSFNVGSNRAL